MLRSEQWQVDLCIRIQLGHNTFKSTKWIVQETLLVIINVINPVDGLAFQHTVEGRLCVGTLPLVFSGRFQCVEHLCPIPDEREHDHDSEEHQHYKAVLPHVACRDVERVFQGASGLRCNGCMSVYLSVAVGLWFCCVKWMHVWACICTGEDNSTWLVL